MAKQAYTPSVQKPTDPSAGCWRAAPMAIAAIMHIIIDSDCNGSRHQLRGILLHEGRESWSDFQRRIEYPTLMTANRGIAKRMTKHATASAFVWLSRSGAIDL